MVDVETERKAPAPGLKEKDEEEKSGMDTREEAERLSEGGRSRHAAVKTGPGTPVGSPCRDARRQGSTYSGEKAWKRNEPGRGDPGPRACKNAKGQHIPECPGKEEEKVKKGPECREPRL